MTHKVDVSVTIAASPERVWRAWTGESAQWWTKPYYIDGGRVTGFLMEPHVGGRYVELWGDQGKGYLLGHVIEWLPPHRLGYTWMEKAWGGVVTVVWITFEPEGDGTRVRLVHEGFERLPDSARQRDGYEYGAGELLHRMKTYVEKG